jgi:hypothetical protein
MANSIFTDLIGRDMLSPVLNTGEKAVSKFATSSMASFAALGATIAAAFTVKAITDFTLANVKAAAESEEAWAKWEATQRAAGGAIRLTTQALSELSKELMLNTRFGDEAVVEAASLLSIYENLNSEAFERTIRLAADMASLLGTDLSGATRQLGRALDDPVQGLTQLRRVGIVLNESTKELIKSLQEQGKTAEAQGVLFDVLEKKFDGLAEAMGETTTGQMEKLKNAWGELQEEMGKLVLPTANSFFKDLNEDLKETDGNLYAILNKMAGIKIFNDGSFFTGEQLEEIQPAPTEEEDAAKWQEFYDAMIAQEKVRTEQEKRHQELIDKSRMEREGIEERAQEVDRATDIESAEQRRIEGLVAGLAGAGRIRKDMAIEEKPFEAAFESLTDLNRRISQAAASGTPEEKVREAIVEQGAKQVQAAEANKKVNEEIRDHLKTLTDPFATKVDTGLA